LVSFRYFCIVVKENHESLKFAPQGRQLLVDVRQNAWVA